MAEPARNLDESLGHVYDEPTGTAASSPKPDLKALEGGGKTTEPKRGHLKEAGDGGPSRDELSNAEEASGAPDPRHENQIGTGYRNGQPQSSRFSLRGPLTKKKGLLGGGIIGIIIATIISFFAVGPLEFVHLSQILQRNFFSTNNTIKIRNKSLLRYARTGNVEETRLGSLGSRVYSRTLSQLKDQGIEFQRVNGVPESMTIDTNNNDNYKDLSPAERENEIIRDFNITDPKIISETGSLGSGKFKIDLKNTSIKGIDFINATAKTAIGSLGNGKIESGLSLRYVRDAWKLPSLFHPLRKITSPLENQVSGLLTKQQADQAEKERLAAEEAIVADSPAAVQAKSDFREAIEKNQSKIVGALIATAGLCAIRSAADAAVTVNRAMIVLPATVQAADKIALGSQGQSGQDFSLTQLGAVKDSFTDSNGHTIWEAQALKATEGTISPSGPDLWVKYKQAFDSNTTANNIKDAININVAGLNITDAVCSKTGQFLQLIAGGIIIIVNLPDGDAGAAAYAATVYGLVKSAVAFGGVLYAIEKFGPQLVSDKAVVPEILSGPIGGNLLAYGARELSNTGARSMGGVALDNTNKSVLSYEEAKEYSQQFNQQSIATRLFDIYDERSAAAKLVDNISPSIQQNLATMGGWLTNFGHMFTSPFTAFMPRVAASTGPYDWGFPKYGFSQSLTEDKNYEDPYSNGDKVAAMLDQGGCATDSGCDLRKKAMACFGVDINKDSQNLWEVVAKSDINPDSSSYIPSDCADTSDAWNRLRLFVLDSRIMDTVACHQGTDEQSCVNLGMASSTSSGATSQTSTPGSLPTGDPLTLATQLVQYINNGKIKCTTSGCPDIVNTASGTSIKGGQGCLVDALQPALLGMLLELVQMGHTFTLSALCSDHRTDGLAGHAGGRAADFNTIDGTYMGPNDTPWSQPKIDAGKKLDQDIASFMPKSTGFGQTQCHPVFDFLSTFNTFPDSCHHQHVQVEI